MGLEPRSPVQDSLVDRSERHRPRRYQKLGRAIGRRTRESLPPHGSQPDRRHSVPSQRTYAPACIWPARLRAPAGAGGRNDFVGGQNYTARRIRVRVSVGDPRRRICGRRRWGPRVSRRRRWLSELARRKSRRLRDQHPAQPQPDHGAHASCGLPHDQGAPSPWRLVDGTLNRTGFRAHLVTGVPPFQRLRVQRSRPPRIRPGVYARGGA